MKNLFEKLIILVGGLIAAAVLAVIGYHFYQRATAGVCRSYTSPDGRFKLVVYGMTRLIASPGDGGSFPGFVRLYDQTSGKLLEQKDFESAQQIDVPEWSATNVFISCFADWTLSNQK